MITIADGIFTIPDDEIFLGTAGDNLHRQKTFFIPKLNGEGWLFRLYLTFDNGESNSIILPASVGSNGTTLVWDIQKNHILKSGLIKAQIKAFSENQEIYHTTPNVFVAGKGTLENSGENQYFEFLMLEDRLNKFYEQVYGLSLHLPYVGENGNWFIYNETEAKYEDSLVHFDFSLKDGEVTPKKLDRQYRQLLIPEDSITSWQALRDFADASENQKPFENGAVALVSFTTNVFGQNGKFELKRSQDDSRTFFAISTENPTGVVYKLHTAREVYEELRFNTPDNGSILPWHLSETYIRFEKWDNSIMGGLEEFKYRVEDDEVFDDGGVVRLFINTADSLNGWYDVRKSTELNKFIFVSPQNPVGDVWVVNLYPLTAERVVAKVAADESYNPESLNAQSGKAVAEAIGTRLSAECTDYPFHLIGGTGIEPKAGEADASFSQDNIVFYPGGDDKIFEGPQRVGFRELKNQILKIADRGNYFDADNAEDALQEIGSTLNGLENLLAGI